MKKIKLLIGVIGLLILLAGCSTLKKQTAGSADRIPVGYWEPVDYVQNVEDFKPDVKLFKGKFFFYELKSLENGRIYQGYSIYYSVPKDGLISSPDGKIKYQYFLKKINGYTYLFLPYMNWDVLYNNSSPWYQVYKKETYMTEAQLKKTNFLKFSRIDEAQKLSAGKGEKVAVLGWCFDMSPEAKKMYSDATSLVPGKPLGLEKPAHGAWMVNLIHRVAPEAKIMPIRVVPDSYANEKEGVFARQKYIEEGIKYAADHGAVAVTTSTGLVMDTPELKEAIDYAESKGCIFVDDHPEGKGWNGEFGVYPPKDELNNKIIHPAPYPALDNPQLPDSLRDIYVWGYDVTNTFGNNWGYSNTPPIVGGVIALIKSANPALTPEQIRNIIYSTGMFINGYKVLNAEAAVKKAIEMKGNQQ